jgi:hypothetical protein
MIKFALFQFIMLNLPILCVNTILLLLCTFQLRSVILGRNVALGVWKWSVEKIFLRKREKVTDVQKNYNTYIHIYKYIALPSNMCCSCIEQNAS